MACFRLMLGLMLPTWFLSMWISNTATTAMMIPIANAILVQLKEAKSEVEAEVNGVATHDSGKYDGALTFSCNNSYISL